MASLTRPCRRLLHSPFSFSNTVLERLLYRHQSPSLQVCQDHAPKFSTQVRYSASESSVQSPFDSNIIRILRTEIEYQSDYAPPHQPVSHFCHFEIEDHPGEQWIRLKGKSEDEENIKIEATMFDGCVSLPRPGDDTDGEDICLHISFIVDISKQVGSETLEFVCSAWPDSVEIQKVYMLPHDGLQPKAYMGPNFRNLDAKFQKALHGYLEARGVNSELSVFLHEYMMNKDRTELIRWLDTVKSFFEQ
ncbi:hypothetical protein Nepgr_000795 [Nepenthes gracilis]|uniref:Mitochondrial glycoprotein n=1 Tax=Nepenthes gracilis TaxID=150966 RepID=A0AAD3RWT4_NEPGR|nr:hypothetical protein Nepgr_000795 [Nepenthes gracilis]